MPQSASSPSLRQNHSHSWSRRSATFRHSYSLDCARTLERGAECEFSAYGNTAPARPATSCCPREADGIDVLANETAAVAIHVRIRLVRVLGFEPSDEAGHGRNGLNDFAFLFRLDKHAQSPLLFLALSGLNYPIAPDALDELLQIIGEDLDGVGELLDVGVVSLESKRQRDR